MTDKKLSDERTLGIHQEAVRELERELAQETRLASVLDTVKQWENHDARRRNEDDWSLVDDLLSDLRDDLGVSG